MTRTTMVEKIRDELAAEMGTQTFPLGSKLPNEQILATRFEVSRATIREAVRGLVERGLVSRIHGSGTYVTAGRPQHSLDASLSYTAMIEEAGFEAGLMLLGVRTRPADEDEAARLGLASGAEVLEVERVRTANGLSVVYSRDRIPANVLTAEAIKGPSLHRALASVGVTVGTASARLLPVVADRHLAEVLAIKAGTPLLHIEQTDFDQTGQPVMASSEWHVSDVFELRVNRRAAAR